MYNERKKDVFFLFILFNPRDESKQTAENVQKMSLETFLIYKNKTNKTTEKIPFVVCNE